MCLAGEIHPELIAAYDTAYEQACATVRIDPQLQTLNQLIAARNRLAQACTGFLQVRERGFHDGELDTIQARITHWGKTGEAEETS